MQTQNTYILLTVRTVIEPKPHFEVLITKKGSPICEELCKIDGQPWYVPAYCGSPTERAYPGIISFKPNAVPICPQENTTEQVCRSIVRSFFSPDTNHTFLREGITEPSIRRPNAQLFVPILASVEISEVKLRMTVGDCRWCSAEELLDAIRRHNPIDGRYSHYIVAIAKTLDIFLTRKPHSIALLA